MNLVSDTDVPEKHYLWCTEYISRYVTVPNSSCLIIFLLKTQDFNLFFTHCLLSTSHAYWNYIFTYYKKLITYSGPRRRITYICNYMPFSIKLHDTPIGNALVILSAIYIDTNSCPPPAQAISKSTRLTHLNNKLHRHHYKHFKI